MGRGVLSSSPPEAGGEPADSGRVSLGNRVPSIVLPVLAALTIAVAYAPVAVELARDWWRDPNYSHGMLVPLISLWLLRERRHELRALPVKPSRWGFPGVLAAGGMLVMGTAGAEVFTQRVSLVVLLASAVLFLAGFAWLRRTAFPIAFLLLAIPLPYVVYYGLTLPLQGVAADCAVVGMRGIGILAMEEGNIIHLPGASLEVAEACSGIRSLFAFLALGALLARSLPIAAWGRVLVFLLTVPLSVAGNAVRVWATGVGTHLVGPSVAEGAFHEFFGLFVFIVSLILLFLFSRAARSLWRAGR